MPLPRSLEAHRLRRRGRPSAALGGGLVLAVVVAGCGGLERAGVSFVAGQRDVAGRVLRSGVPTETAELSLVLAALELVPAAGRPRPSVEGRAHFSRPAASFYGLRLVRPEAGGARDGPRGTRGVEEWRLDYEWALRELPEGITLCWQGDLRLAVETLGVVLPPSEGR